jgi:hypothetical protein
VTAAVAGIGAGSAAVGAAVVDGDVGDVVVDGDVDAAGAVDWAIDAVDTASITKIIYDDIFFIISS